MKRIIYILLVFIGSLVNAQGYDFQQLCLSCAEQEGFYCGDDPANWTQYAPLGCVQTAWLNDGWEDCVDATDENGSVPTIPADCAPPVEPCDTVYVDVIEYVDIFITDTILEINTVYFTEFDTIVEYVIDSVYIYEDILDTLIIYETEYVDVFIFDTIVEYETQFVVEFIDCDTGAPCDNSALLEIMKGSFGTNIMYNLNGQVIRKPNGIYIQNGEIKMEFESRY